MRVTGHNSTGEDYARPAQTESVSTGNTQTDYVGESDGRAAREHLDAGLAGKSEGADSSRGVSVGVQESGSEGQGGGSAGVQPPVELGKKGSDGNDGRVPNGGLVISSADVRHMRRSF